MPVRPFPGGAADQVYDSFSRQAANEFAADGVISSSAALVQVDELGAVENFAATPGFLSSAFDSVQSKNRTGELIRFMFAGAVDSEDRQIRAWGVRVDAIVVISPGTVVVDPKKRSPYDLAMFPAAWPLHSAEPMSAFTVTVHTPDGSYVGVLVGVPGADNKLRGVARGPLWPTHAVRGRMLLTLDQPPEPRRPVARARRLRPAAPVASAAFQSWLHRVAKGSLR